MSLLSRVFFAFGAFFRAILSGTYAARIAGLGAPPLPAVTPPAAAAPAPVVLREASPDAALQLLALLQREGRFVDFLQEDLSSFSDAEIGAAARVVYEGCRKTLAEHVSLVPVMRDEEGSAVAVAQGFNAAEIRLTGNVQGEPPFRGTLRHRGWRASVVRLPKLAEKHDAHVIAPAEIEL